MKRTLEEYMKLPYRMEIVEDEYEGGYALWFPELPGAVTCGETIEEVLSLADDCKRTWLEAAIEDLDEIPEPDEYRKYSGQFKLRLPKDLHKKLYTRAREQGISMNTYCIYLLAKNSAIESLSK